MVGRQEPVQRVSARLPEQLRGVTGAHPVEGFLDGLIGGLILGAALALFVVQRGTVVEVEPLQEASIELKERATQRAQRARGGTGSIVEQGSTLTEEAKAALDRPVPGDKITEA